ncbi:universal stress protein [Pseudoduganella sp. RAF53_2]|jgi:nucleotide-binding universal stress UspA family protein|uniref:universal stress protein n=1 Tax=unclassified Pseudoduganella TaxID=2637179 RepID=UPI003F9C5B9D
MFKSILLPTDGSQLSERATETAVRFAQLNGAKLVAVSVIQPFPLVPMSEAVVVPDAAIFDRHADEYARNCLDRVATAARAAGVPFEGVMTQSATPYEEIVKAAEQHGCDIILMASHGRKGLNKLFLGSETQKVLAHTTLPVLVLR